MRDLQKDLEICQAATPEPWEMFETASCKLGIYSPQATVLGLDIQERYQDDEEYRGIYVSLRISPADERFILEARNGGWKEAIQRAMDAEAQVKQLKAQLAACSSIALGINHDLKPGDYAYSEAYADVVNLRQRTLMAEARVKELKANLLGYIDMALHAALSTLKPGMPCDLWTLHEMGMRAARELLEKEASKGDGQNA